jgi:RNA polymerase-binding transcription factor DksA
MAKSTAKNKKTSTAKTSSGGKKKTAKSKAMSKETGSRSTTRSKSKTAAAKKSSKKNTSTAKPKKTAAKKTTSKKTAAKKTTAKKIKKSPAARTVEVVAKPKKTKRSKTYSKKDLEAFKKVIMEKRSEIMEQLQDLRDQMMDPSTGQYVNESSPYSLHMAEQGTDAQEREKLYLWAQRENKFLGYLEEALQRIENGTYGICIECIDEPKNLCPTCPLVPKERLMAVPHTQLCVQVKMNQKK